MPGTIVTKIVPLTVLILFLVGLAGCENTSNKGERDVSLMFKEQYCYGGIVNSCLELANDYLKTKNPIQNVSKIEKALQTACNLGSGLGCYNLAGIKEIDGWYGTDKNEAAGLYIAAMNYYEMECKAGEAISCYNLGVMYQLGQKTNKDLSQAIPNFEKACTANMAKACTNVATIYINENNGYTNTDRAISLFQKACTWRDDLACTKLGVLYSTGGMGVSRDGEAGRKYYDKSCKLNPRTALCQKILNKN